jgi:hypothetical protein
VRDAPPITEGTGKKRKPRPKGKKTSVLKQESTGLEGSVDSMSVQEEEVE